jgi:hypothetical protein
MGTETDTQTSSPVSTETKLSMKIAGSDLYGNRHVCAFFRMPNEEYGVLLRFIKDGLDRGEKAFQVEIRNPGSNTCDNLCGLVLMLKARSKVDNWSFATGSRPI